MISVSNDFINAVSSQTRQFDARVTLNIPNYLNNQTYGNDKIIKFDTTEEFTTMSDTLPSDQCQITLDNRDGTFNFLNYNNMTQILAGKPTIYIELGLHTPYGSSTIEWVPAGYFFMDNFKLDPVVQTVTLIGHDWLSIMSNFDFPPSSFSNMNNLLYQVFQIVGCTNYSIDPAVTNAPYNTPKQTTQDMDCRQVLQHVGVATMCAVYQDRSGKMIIKPYPTLANNGYFSTYVSSQTQFWGYTTTQYNVYSEIDDDGGNRRIPLANMYEIPMIELQKSIYQIKVNVYSSGSVAHSNTYTNNALNGTNGVSFTIDNPLIDSDTVAQNVANFFFTESNYNANYTCQWRQNPSIQCGDIVLVDDGQTVGGVPQSSNKISRVIKQEFVYNGSLSGTSEVRGGA